MLIHEFSRVVDVIRRRGIVVANYQKCRTGRAESSVAGHVAQGETNRFTWFGEAIISDQHVKGLLGFTRGKAQRADCRGVVADLSGRAIRS